MNARSRVERLRMLGAAFSQSDCTRLEFRDGDFEVELSRRGQRPAAVAVPAQPPAAQAAPSPAPSPPAERIVHAELVGIVRMPRTPLAVGQVFERDREVAVIESLGIRSPIQSGGPGRVTRVLVDDGDAVDYGQALFVVEHV